MTPEYLENPAAMEIADYVCDSWSILANPTNQWVVAGYDWKFTHPMDYSEEEYCCVENFVAAHPTLGKVWGFDRQCVDWKHKDWSRRTAWRFHSPIRTYVHATSQEACDDFLKNFSVFKFRNPFEYD